MKEAIGIGACSISYRVILIPIFTMIIGSCGSVESVSRRLETSTPQPAEIEDPRGGWTGGGGLLSKDSFNPWWVNNTKTINVCIQIDEKNFGISADRAEEITRGSIDWWVRAFKSVQHPASDNPAGVGSQDFHFSRQCGEDSDLRVQFGILDKEQQRLWSKFVVESPQQHAAIAVRTQYDRVNMRGKGFIYLSPQNGALKLQLENDQVKQPWTVGNGSLAALFLMHELGHVFGYQHGSAAGWVTSSTLINHELQAFSAEKYDKLPEPYKFLSSPFQVSASSSDACFQTGDYENGREFFGLPDGPICVALALKDSKLSILNKRSTNAAFELHSVVELREIGSSRRSEDINEIYLPAENVVFPVADRQNRTPYPRLIQLPVSPLCTQWEGRFRIEGDPTERLVLINRCNGQDKFGIVGRLDGKKMETMDLLPSED